MKTRMIYDKTVILTAALALSLTSCVKDDLYNTPHPDKGAVVITTDWKGRSSDAVLPESYILRIGTQEQTVSGETNAFNALFLPGQQDLLVHNITEGVTTKGNTATVNTLSDGTLEAMPGYLFSASETLEITKDDTLRVTVSMRQHIRSLRLVLRLKPGDEGRIAGTTATLTGVASGVDLPTGILTDTGGKVVVPVFVPGTDGGTRAEGKPQLAATLRLLGVTDGERQILTVVLTLTDGYVQTVTTDLTEALKNFGSSVEPLVLDAMLNLPVSAGMSATITGWNVVDNGDIKVN